MSWPALKCFPLPANTMTDTSASQRLDRTKQTQWPITRSSEHCDSQGSFNVISADLAARFICVTTSLLRPARSGNFLPQLTFEHLATGVARHDSKLHDPWHFEVRKLLFGEIDDLIMVIDLPGAPPRTPYSPHPFSLVRHTDNRGFGDAVEFGARACLTGWRRR